MNRDLARRSLEKLLSWDFDKLVIAHGVCVEKDAKPFVERAFRWLVTMSAVVFLKLRFPTQRCVP